MTGSTFPPLSGCARPYPNLGCCTWGTARFQVRRALANQQETLAGLYVGNPKRATAHPTTELLLAQFRDMTLTLLEVPPDLYLHITPLNPLQQKILALLNLPESIYSGLEPESQIPL